MLGAEWLAPELYICPLSPLKVVSLRSAQLPTPARFTLLYHAQKISMNTNSTDTVPYIIW